MNSAERGVVLHCLKSMIDEAACEECPLYGTTGTDHCEKDCVRLAINTLEQEPCGDAISREAAVDACLNGWNKDYKEIVAEIRALPPVTPQYTDAEIQKMQDLESVEIQTAYEIGKEEGSSEKPNKWIPVSERLPENHDDVLVWVEYIKDDYDCAWWALAYYSRQHKKWVVSTNERNPIVKAWMPLPEPFEGNTK